MALRRRHSLLSYHEHSRVKSQGHDKISFVVACGGDEGDRTPYLLNAIQALSQVSYAPTFSVPSSVFNAIRSGANQCVPLGVV